MTLRKSLFINARIWHPTGRFDEAFGISGVKFDFKGTNAEALQIKSNYSEICDLGGKLVLPGLIDGHLHLCHGSLMYKRLDAGGIYSAENLKSVVAGFAADNPGTEWIIGSNINLNTVFKDYKITSDNLLDSIYSAKPLYIANYDFHSGICNSLAIERSGLNTEMKNFSDEEIIVNKNGNPTGIVKEKALNFIRENLPLPSFEGKSSAAYGLIRMLNSFGITSISDITQTDDIKVYNRLFFEGKLKLRINSYIPLEEYVNIDTHRQSAKQIDRNYFCIRGFKAYYDGALGSDTALFSKNYSGKNHNGYETNLVKEGKLDRFAHEIDKQGSQLIIHAIGDLAVTRVLDLYENLNNVNGIRDRRHRIEHAQHINVKDMSRFKKLGVIASVQPLHLKYDIETVNSKLPEELIHTTHNYKKLIDLGAIINLGTDFPIVEANPFENMKMAITRNSGSGVFYPENCIDLHNCIKAYTINNAYSNFNEKELGTIEPGKLADFVIMENDLFEMKPEDIGAARVLNTYIDGEEVFAAADG